MKEFKANGKLLISGEYAVLDGALALAIPTRCGQSLNVKYLNSESKNQLLFWEAYLHDNNLWFSAVFNLNNLEIVESTNQKLAENLQNILRSVEKLNPNSFHSENQNIYFRTKLEFPQEWGWGSSSTLLSLLAQFAKIDAFKLNDLTFKTSGYDVACATANSPIFYQILNEKRKIQSISFNPEFKEELFFVHLNQKQDTQISVSQVYKNLPKNEKWVDEISSISENLTMAKNLSEFENLMNRHEELVSSHLNLPKVKDVYFSDYDGSIKSLGAWGGDFVLVTKIDHFEEYFKSKGFSTILKYSDVFSESK